MGSVVPLKFVWAARETGVSFLVLLLSVGLGSLVAPFFATHSASSTNIVVQGIIQDPKAAEIAAATMDLELVQWGTTNPYTGTGAPGVLLSISNASNILNWTLDAWANQTSPSAIPTCNSPGIHFTSYDWTLQFSSGDGSSSGTYVSTPSTVPSRLMLNGDQCFARVAAVGAWDVHLCVDASSTGPRGIYTGADGQLHEDTWDRCVDRTFQV